MIRSVDFISRINAEALQERADLAMISITEPESSPADLSCREENVLRLVFHDVDPGHETTSNSTLFNESHANQVVHFVRRLDAHDQSFDLVIHCKAGISRSAAIALFAESETGCGFPRRPFAGLANMHVMAMLEKITGKALSRPRALPKRETFSVSVFRNFETGQAVVTVANERNGEQVTIEGPMLDVPALATDGMQRVWGVSKPPPSYHVADWDTLSQGLEALPRTCDRQFEASIKASPALEALMAAGDLNASMLTDLDEWERMVPVGLECDIEITEEDGEFVARCPNPEVASDGKTPEEALANLRQALALYLEKNR